MSSIQYWFYDVLYILEFYASKGVYMSSGSKAFPPSLINYNHFVRHESRAKIAVYKTIRNYVN